MTGPQGRKIKSRSRAKQLVLFKGLQWGRISATDMDGVIEIGDKALILIEVKHHRAIMPVGQRLLHERLTDAWQETGREGIAIVARHGTRAPQSIDLARCVVSEYRRMGRWHPDGKRTVKEVIDAYLRRWGIELEGVA